MTYEKLAADNQNKSDREKETAMEKIAHPAGISHR
jgi:hypothetical protein